MEKQNNTDLHMAIELNGHGGKSFLWNIPPWKFFWEIMDVKNGGIMTV